MGFFTNKKVLIIGGTGTIGRNLLFQVLADNPTVVRILSRDEHKQFELQRELVEFTNIRYLIGDVRDLERLERAMQDIDYVFHAAAMKHVPACEYNPFEAVQTNVIGTQNVIQAALRTGVKRTIFTSTDKAISPTNTYGASKLMAERLISAAQSQAGSRDTLFAAVRFGNVMGSRGSVIPLFQWQIKEKREITVTDPESTRFMMTVQQATGLTLRAMQLARGGEIFVLKMPVIRLRELAETVIEEYTDVLGIPTHSVNVKHIGLRPGEKMFEELMTEAEAEHAIELPDMFVIPNVFLNKSTDYPDGKRAAIRSYSSHTVPPIAKDEVRSIITRNGLLGREGDGRAAW
jgi:FlaA1/EpsC-like NDP-sugar epimerase